ncbi:hypothetical protein [Paenibacillus sp. 1P07SE]|uniref:hypothetical protein n=1 Tax=Paenibacillus sp. 1P07SE TaxID=3132209 RepID=UPI0039A598D8
MEKRLSRTEMLFSLGFLFMLVVAVAAFFYGVKVGAEKTETKYQPMKLLQSEGGGAAYQQQDLVSFYHTVFLPHREFQNEWHSALSRIRSQQATQPKAAFKDLEKLAAQKYSQAAEAALPATSPLLAQGQVNLLKSLRLFEQTAARMAASADSKQAQLLLKELAEDAFYQQAVQHAGIGQQEYYAAMLKWSASVNTEIPGDYEMPQIMEISVWKQLPLTIKNKLMADQLVARSILPAYYPQDLSTRVDEFIATGEAARMKIRTVTAVVDLLLGTKAVRTGDFAASKATLYSEELLPQLPFFFPE